MNDVETDMPARRVGTRAVADDPEALAKHAITLFEQHLRDSYHLKVQLGVEQEYSLILKPDAPVQRMASGLTDPLHLGQYVELPRMFKLSRFVAYSYPEGHGARHPGGSCFQYEAVTDHTHPMPLHLLPNAINQLRHELAHGGARMVNADGTIQDPPATTKITRHNITHPRRIRQAKWYQANVDEVRFDSPPETKIINGLHLNFSLLPVSQNAGTKQWETGKPILKSMDPLMTALVDTTNRYFNEEEFLFNRTDSQTFRAHARREEGLYPYVSIRNTDVEDKATPAPKGMPCYLENKTPPADCNAYYAVMTQLAAIVDGVGQTHGQQATNLTALLNALEPDLGTRFRAAEQAHPELKSYHTMPEISAKRGAARY
jgi:glutamine synthetase